MLTVQPHGVLRNGFDLFDESDREVGAFAGSAWRETGQIRVGGQVWEFRKERSRRFVLAGPQGVLAAAERTSVWNGRWQLTTGGRAYELAKRSWSRTYELRRDGAVVGEVAARGVFSGKAAAALPTELPLPVQVFVVAIVMALWRRQQAAAAGAAAGGGAAAASG